ncbi:MAG: lytic murein transglycosylase, partial [Nitrosomonas sp.]|nr:lytic murein transglycosylase [Nitrosomonas sp.]
MKLISNSIRYCTFFLLFISSLIPLSAKADAGFQQWIADFYPTAAQNGISRSIYDLAFNGVTSPDPDVLAKARYQPEFTSKIWDYLDARVNPLTIANGQLMAKQHEETLAKIEQQFGISRFILLAIWSVESNYGAVLERTERLHYVPQSLATLAYADNRRKKFARSQLIAALKILQSGDITSDQLMGSWAGAMGHTQFIPTSYQAYAVDMDNNGSRDIWNSIPDALATAANLLKQNGWRTGETWGYEVKLPINGQQYEGSTKTLAEWGKLGFIAANGSPFPRPGKNAVLKLMPDAEKPAFLMTRNFYILKRYNNSDFYALSVGLLADRLAGSKGLIQSWPRPPGSLTVNEKFEFQQQLKKLGFYTGEIDGNLGKGTQQAIR